MKAYHGLISYNRMAKLSINSEDYLSQAKKTQTFVAGLSQFEYASCSSVKLSFAGSSEGSESKK